MAYSGHAGRKWMGRSAPEASPVPELGLAQFEFGAFSAQVVGGVEASDTKTLLVSGFQCSSGCFNVSPAPLQVILFPRTRLLGVEIPAPKCSCQLQRTPPRFVFRKNSP